MKPIIRRILITILSLALLSVIAGVVLYQVFIAPDVDEIGVEVLRDVQFQVPLKIYTNDGHLVAEYGNKKRMPITYADLPNTMVKAIISAEDDRFFEHPGVDYQGLLRAAYYLVTTGEKAQGGSTITMQVTRNFFLSREKTYLRKITEIFLSLKIEKELTKEKILELYLNKIYFGNRAYGVASAAQVYYGKSLHELSLGQMAMIAGLPKAPSRFNPLANAERAIIRRDYVLGRMQALGHISIAEYHEAKNQPTSAKLHRVGVSTEASYVGEMVRAHMVDKYGDSAYTSGFKVYITLDKSMQNAANLALRDNLQAYDQRHGYRGPVTRIELPPELLARYQEKSSFDATVNGRVLVDIDELETYRFDELEALSKVGGLIPALVVFTDDRSATALLKNGEDILLSWQGLAWARSYVDANHQGRKPKVTADVLMPGDLIYITKEQVEDTEDHYWRLAQIPAVAGAIVAIDPNSGAIRALSGGFDFFYSKFNRVTQARRQPGSSFKPFVYSAALDKGFTPASIINDAPVVFNDSGLESSWRPENYSGRFYGPTRLRQALTKSRNLVSIRLLQSIGIKYGVDYVSQFGFDKQRLPRDLSLSLGSGAVTPFELAAGYTVFANGGYRIPPYFIERIENIKGTVVFSAVPYQICDECEEQAPEIEVELFEPEFISAKRVMSEATVYQITSMMRDVVSRGTGRRAMRLGRHDLAGKTGTTNDQKDAWFAGFNGHLVAVSWVGFDDAQSLGDRETGSRAALPMWIDFMEKALEGRLETPLSEPPGMVTVRIDPETGLLAGAKQRDAIFETFRIERAPQQRTPDIDDSTSGPEEQQSPQLLF